jgi:hypothetical protein
MRVRRTGVWRIRMQVRSGLGMRMRTGIGMRTGSRRRVTWMCEAGRRSHSHRRHPTASGTPAPATMGQRVSGYTPHKYSTENHQVPSHGSASLSFENHG